MTAKTEAQQRAAAIRQHAHRLAAEGIRAALNMWELDRYYPAQEDQDQLETELVDIANRLQKQGEKR